MTVNIAKLMEEGEQVYLIYLDRSKRRSAQFLMVDCCLNWSHGAFQEHYSR